MKLGTKVALATVALAGGITIANMDFDVQQSKIAASMWGNGHENTVAQTTQSYILQGQNTTQLAQVVSNVGGQLDREFPIINAVSALLTPNQANEIKTLAGIRVQDDRTVMTMSLSSSFTTGSASDNYIASQVMASELHRLNIKGDGVTIAFIDSGANMGSKDGAPIFRDSYSRQKVAVKYDSLTAQETYYYNDDSNGHGTHITNIAGSALMSPEGNFNGIAPDAYLLSVRAFDANGQSSYSKVLDALNWIFDNRLEHKIRVVNMSLGSSVQSRYWDDPINQAVMRLWDAGIVVVASGGNSGKEMGITVPGNNPYIITVGAASDAGTPFDFSDDRIASFSAKGPTLDGFVKPDVVAPGTNISVKMDTRFTTMQPSTSDVGSGYYAVSGTSQSSAIVAGVAALIIQNDPYITPDDVKCRIMASAKVSAANGVFNFSPFEQGAGLVNAYDAVMSNTSGCANKGLDIKADLAGTARYLGPVIKDETGEFAIELEDGSVLVNGAHWGHSELDLLGAHWGHSELNLLGAHWGHSELELLGAHWGHSELSLQGAHWGHSELELLGAHWGHSELELLGAHWGHSDLDLLGTGWSHTVGLLSADEQVTPINTIVQVPIQDSGWQ